METNQLSKYDMSTKHLYDHDNDYKVLMICFKML